MTSERIQSALTIFRRACELPTHERAAFVRAACAGDEALVAEVESMLAWDDGHDDEAAPGPARAVLAELADRAEADSLSPGSRDGQGTLPEAIGGYRIVRLIARGGMGDVYEARQDHPSRRVALKVARIGSPRGERARRFALEVQLLARLRHPGIASIIEAGTTDPADGEQPFFAMDFVDGQPLTDYAQKHLTGVRPRLELMVSVCAAVAYAHAQGVVHRDLKPDNVLTEADGTPRVLDFGVAKVQEAGGFGAATLRTEAGRVLGTMGYMAPEQLAGRTAELGPAADVYSLGVMLYELLTGRLPHDLTQATLTSALAIVTSTDAPLLGVIRPELRGDIEAVVAKALEKDPRHRYRDAGALQQDLERHLRGEPTLARPAGPLLRMTKWIRRNPVLASSVLGLFLTLTAVVTLLTVSTTEAHAALSQQTRLLDVRRASMARDDTDRKLWPARPATVFALKKWLDDKRQREGRLHEYRAWLDEVRAQYGTRVGDRWTFTDELQQNEHDDVAQMVQDIEALQADSGLLARVQARLGLAHTIVAQTVTSRQVDWDAVNARIAANAIYGGRLAIAPRVGFVPLGPDPDSHLEEFLALDTHEGPLPVRDEHGGIAVTEQLGLVFALIPGGTFTMGAQRDENGPNHDAKARPNEAPPHEVTLDPFYLSKYEMTRGQWLRLTIDEPPWETDENREGANPMLLPAANVSRTEFIRKLAQLELLLPTEAQWERGARGVDADGHPSSTPWPGCTEKEQLAGKANLAGEETRGIPMFRMPDSWKQDDYVGYAPVGSFPPNSFGIHDVIGNAAEWCRDHFGPYDGTNERPGDGYRDSTDTLLVFRGGCFVMGSALSRTAMRFTQKAQGETMFETGVRPVAVCVRREGR
ncbi:MAG: bifunctional serine/threonine-protein kinase/formylglycine-generating enzyme family protein [Planctomycetota bacterium]